MNSTDEGQSFDRSGEVEILPEKLFTQNEVDILIEKQENDRIVKSLIRKSNGILVSISSHALPFDLFPNTINVEERRITVINRHMFSSNINSIDIRNISNIFINNSILFSQLVIISKTFEENEIKVRNLWTKEAQFVRRIIEGLRTFESNEIDTSGYTNIELMEKLEGLNSKHAGM